MNFTYAEPELTEWQKRQLKNKEQMESMIKKVSQVLDTIVNDTDIYDYKSKLGPHLTKLGTLEEIDKIANRLIMSQYIKQGAVPTVNEKTYITDLKCTNTSITRDPAYWILKVSSCLNVYIIPVNS